MTSRFQRLAIYLVSPPAIKTLLIAICGAATVIMLLTDAWIILARLRNGSTLVPGDSLYFMSLVDLASKNAVVAASESPYPPVFLLAIAAFSTLSPASFYLGWLFVSTGLLTLAARSLRIPWPAIGLGLLSAPNLYCIAMGQTGTIISALLLLSLGLAETSPAIAGIAAGCLIIKPQFALLLPICFLASKNRTAFIVAAVTVILLCLLTSLVFGTEIWRAYFFHKTAVNLNFLNKKWPEVYQYSMVTIFMTARSLGISLFASDMVQIICSTGAVLTCWYIWRQTRTDRLVRLMITLCLVVIATPYAYLYDITAIAVALCAYARRPYVTAWLPLALFWVCTCLYGFISMWSFLTGGLVLLAILIFLLPKLTLPATA
jgi:hypothetical protein